MRAFNRTILITLSLCLLCIPVTAQGDDKVDIFSSVVGVESTRACRKIELGSPLAEVIPEFPLEARSKRLGGAVRLEVRIDETGNVDGLISASGDEVFIAAAKEALAKTRFSVSRCDGRPIAVNGMLTYNFVQIALTDSYVKPETAAEFPDLRPEMPYYEPVVLLTENYKLAFGYADGKFHGEAPLTKGDFAHFLRLTLDLLQHQAEVSQKIPREIELYFPVNRHKLTSSEAISDLEPGKPYNLSIGFLISKYDIALVNSERQFQGKLPLSNNEVIRYWQAIFGRDAVPVNFHLIKNGDRIMTRGEFALFLQESLNVLTYKVLP